MFTIEGENMKILAINSSPNKEGNGHHLSEFLNTQFQDQQIELEEIHLSQNQIQGCTACYKCFENQNGQCVLKKDNLNNVIEKMVEAQGVVFISPVYTGSVTASMKAFMERASLVSMASGGLFDRKPGAAIAIARRAGTLSTLEPMQHFMHICGMISVGSTYWNIVFGGKAGDVLKDAEGLETLKNLSLNMGWLIKTIDQSTVPAPETIRSTACNFIRDDL